MAIAGSGALSAELSEDDTDPSGLDEIIVHATRMDKRIDEVPAAISVISKDDIQRGRQQLGLDESLAAIPGVFIQSPYNFSRDLRIAIREPFMPRTGVAYDDVAESIHALEKAGLIPSIRLIRENSAGESHNHRRAQARPRGQTGRRTRACLAGPCR